MGAHVREAERVPGGQIQILFPKSRLQSWNKSHKRLSTILYCKNLGLAFYLTLICRLLGDINLQTCSKLKDKHKILKSITLKVSDEC